MRRVQLLREQVPLREGLDTIEGNTRKERNVLEAREEVGRGGLYFGSWGNGARKGRVQDRDIVKGLSTMVR
jgi:hypothetical protein